MDKVQMPISREGRKVRKDKGLMRWTERDQGALPWIGEQYTVRADQLQVLLARWSTEPTQTPGALGIETVRKLVQRWRQDGLVEYAVLVRNQPGWVWLTRRGLEQVSQDYRFWEPRTLGLAHLYAVNQARLWIEQRAVGAHWRSERQLNSERGFVRKQVRGPHRPDAELELEGKCLAVEVELSDKVSERLAAILYGLARTYAGIWYFCPPATQARLQRAVAELNPPEIRQKFAIIPLPLTGGRRVRRAAPLAPTPRGASEAASCPEA